MHRVSQTARSLARALGWLLALALAAPLAFGVSPGPEPLELPEVVVRGIDRVRLEAERAGVLPLEAPRLAQAPTRLELASAAPPAPELAAAPRVQSPGCAYRNPVSGALARATGGAEALYHTGIERLSRDLLDEAAGYLAQLRADHPFHPRADDAAFWLAEIRRRQGRPDEAVAFLRLVRGDLAPEAAYRMAWLLADRGRGEEARRAWEELTRDDRNPHRPEALYRLGAAHYDAGAPRPAQPPLEELATLPGQGVLVPGPVRAAGLLTLGLARRAAGDPRGAEDALVRFLLETPDHPSAPSAQVALGWTLLEQGKTREAAQRFGWIVDSRPPADLLGPSLYGRVRALAEAQDPALPDALLALEAGAPTGPWVGWGRADAGWLAFRQKRYEDALRLYRSALRAWDAPGADVPRYMAAEALYLLGRYDEAAQAYRAVPVDAPLGPAALHRAGLCELLAGRPDRAAELLEEVLRRDPAYPEADRVWAWLGEARLQLGLRDEALRAFHAVPERSPSHAQALYGRAWLAFEGARWDEAAELFARLLRSYPGDPNRDEAVLNLARAHFNRREPRAALGALDRLESETSEPRYRSAARFYRGWMFARSGREAQARTQLAGLLADEPDGPYAAPTHHALGWLDFAAGAYAAALPHFDAALAREPEGDLADEARQKRADSLYNLGRYAEALEAYGALGDVPDAHYGQALSLFRLGRRDELARSAEDFAARHSEDPRRAGLFLVLAQARTEAGEPAAAAAADPRAAAPAP
ncbi:MAG: tetratricopeptide repeat protein, partial [Thermodesulfobacteriota bacterium]